ncbi:unannotated protein [freshwater metagenome]|uniref:Unannotated protein n=1 Tax=freshwater metagenome TaxID=449393 RepID=A0A6J7EXQ3_9ZZZZ
MRVARCGTGGNVNDLGTTTPTSIVPSADEVRYALKLPADESVEFVCFALKIPATQLGRAAVPVSTQVRSVI